MQELWKSQVNWDSPLPETLVRKWSALHSSLSEIKNIHFTRWLGYHPGDIAEIHGFRDASKLAFASVVYIRIRLPDGNYHTHLLTAKSRVAPVKTITIPKLELCAALLTVKLKNSVTNILEIPVANAYAWSDSINTLSWIKANDPSRWRVYVVNRVSEIQRNFFKELVR